MPTSTECAFANRTSEESLMIFNNQNFNCLSELSKVFFTQDLLQDHADLLAKCVP